METASSPFRPHTLITFFLLVLAAVAILALDLDIDPFKKFTFRFTSTSRFLFRPRRIYYNSYIAAMSGPVRRHFHDAPGTHFEPLWAPSAAPRN